MFKNAASDCNNLPMESLTVLHIHSFLSVTTNTVNTEVWNRDMTSVPTSGAKMQYAKLVAKSRNLSLCSLVSFKKHRGSYYHPVHFFQALKCLFYVDQIIQSASFQNNNV